MEERQYKAFISYRHRPLDKQAAEIIQKRIEGFHVPKEFQEAAGGRRLGMVFRDEDELPAGSSLSDSITYALDHTEFLLVICTPDLPLSQWCEKEIRYFLETHDRDHVLAVLVDGEPAESFSPYLLYEYDEQGEVKAEVEPLAADIRGKDHTIDRGRLRKEIVRIYAALLGCPFDALWQRQKRQKTNRLLLMAGAVVAALSIFLGIVLQKNSQITRKNEEITQKNEEITQKNDEITKQNQDLALQKSSLLVEAAQRQLEDHDIHGATKSALEALPSEEGLPYDHQVEQVLAEALGAYQTGDLRKELVYAHTAEIVDLKVSADQEKAYLADWFGNVLCIDLENDTVLWQTLGYIDDIINTESGGGASTRRTLSPDEKKLFCLNTSCIVALSEDTGEQLWAYEKTYAAGIGVLSPDGRRLAVIDRAQDNTMGIAILDTDTGETAARFSIEEEGFEADIGVIYLEDSREESGAFSPDSRYFALAFSQKSLTDSEDQQISYVICDLEKNELKFVGYRPRNILTSVLGVYLSEGGKDLFAICYDRNDYAIQTALFLTETQEVKEDVRSCPLGWGQATASQPPIFSRYLAVLCLDNNVYIYQLKDGALRATLETEEEILDVSWLDEEEEILRLIMSDGEVKEYDLEHDDALSYDPWASIWTWEQEGAILLARNFGGDQ